MQVQGEITAENPARKRGRPALISRSRILEVARTFDSETLTMQAVAAELGVARQALSYHVTDREGLLRLVAEDRFHVTFTETFARHMQTYEGSTDGWKRAMYAWASAHRDGIAAAGVLANFYIISSDGAAVLEPAEIVLQTMISAGFDRTIAQRGLTLLTNLAMGVGRDVVLQKQYGEHPQAEELRRLVAHDSAVQDYTEMLSIIESGINTPDDIQNQFDFAVDVYIHGMERYLT